MICIFLFYNKTLHPKLNAWTLSDDFKHCECITYDGDIYLLYRFGSNGLTSRRIKVNHIGSLVRNLTIIPTLTRMITVTVDNRTTFGWLPLWIKSCNELVRYISGVNIGLTFNPRALFNKLIKYRHNRNYRIIHYWRRNNGRLGRGQ